MACLYYILYSNLFLYAIIKYILENIHINILGIILLSEKVKFFVLLFFLKKSQSIVHYKCFWYNYNFMNVVIYRKQELSLVFYQLLF